VARKLKSARAHDVLARVHVATPRARDDRARPVCIPASVAAVRSANGGRVLIDAPLPPQPHIGDQMFNWDGEGPAPGSLVCDCDFY
jgi:hypothetical protein